MKNKFKPKQKQQDNQKPAGLPTGFYKSIKAALGNSNGVFNLTVTKDEPLPLTEIAKFKNLKTLILRVMDIPELPVEIKELTLLENLDICDSSIETLPPEIGSLSNLRNLNCEGSLLGEIPPEIGRLKKLENISLRETPVEVLPAEFFSLTGLKYLDLNETNITKIPSDIGLLSNLEYLNVSTEQPLFLLDILAKLKKLKQFVIGTPDLPAADLEKIKKVLPAGCKIYR
jgi:Leucine-rich repeat (LRR) protein